VSGYDVDPRLTNLYFWYWLLPWALGPDSPAINAGDDAVCAIPPAQNRYPGVGRPQGLHCDIGVYEYELPLNNPPMITAITTPFAPVQLGQSIDATVEFSDPDVGDSHTITGHGVTVQATRHLLQCLSDCFPHLLICRRLHYFSYHPGQSRRIGFGYIPICGYLRPRWRIRHRWRMDMVAYGCIFSKSGLGGQSHLRVCLQIPKRDKCTYWQH